MSIPEPRRTELTRLIEARDQRLNHAVRSLSAEPSVLGIFLGGSLGARSDDAYSDIDLRVVVTSDQHAAFVKHRLDIPSKWPGFVFNEWMPGTQHCVSHFEPFGKVDIFYFDEAKLGASPWYALPIRVLYDPQGIIGSLIARSQTFGFEVSAEDVSHSISKGLAALHETIRRAKRGELIYAQTLLDEFRQHIMRADDWLFARTPTTAVYAKFDERGSQIALDTIRSSYTALDTGEILRAAAALHLIYKQQVIELHNSFSLSRPLSNDLRAFDIAEAAQNLPAIRRPNDCS